MSKLVGKTVLVVGASRGLGRGVAERFAAAGASVTALARSEPALDQLAAAMPTIGDRGGRRDRFLSGRPDTGAA